MVQLGLEPKVIESIKHNKRQVRYQRALLLLPFVLANIFVAALVAVVFVNGEAPPSVPGKEGSLVLVIVPYVLIIAAGLFANAGYARKRFNAFIRREAPEGRGPAESMFRSALQGVSIGAGMDPPRLVVFEDPSVNAMAFIDRKGRPAIGVTQGALGADFSTGEANAILAHELAHLMMGDQVTPPHPLQLEYMPKNLFALYVFIGLAVAYFAERYNFQFGPIVFVMGLVFAFLLFFLFSETYTLKLLNLAYDHNDILADSIAVEITRDPDALISAIEKVSALVGRVEIASPSAQLAFDEEISLDVKLRLAPYIFDSRKQELARGPGVMFLSRYLFVSPQEAVDEYSRFARMGVEDGVQRRDKRAGISLVGKGRRRAALRFFEMESGEMRERLINLDLIRQGHHRSLSDWNVGD